MCGDHYKQGGCWILSISYHNSNVHSRTVAACMAVGVIISRIVREIVHSRARSTISGVV